MELWPAERSILISVWTLQVFSKVGKQAELRTIEQWLSRWNAQSTGPVHHREFDKVCKVLELCLAINSTQVSLFGS